MRTRPEVVRTVLRGCRPLFASQRISVRGKRQMYELFTDRDGHRSAEAYRKGGSFTRCPAAARRLWSSRFRGFSPKSSTGATVCQDGNLSGCSSGLAVLR
jgi:hypothetical protein